ncbi:hypothetical protein EOE18_06375 [Novosphingobium umbonatum]|uniref:Type VI secretion protein n=1 Tax=Novosphingobium umbonatum TaxID=1908524 RepID=A0A3S2X5T0_9SPHN|nr:TrbC/VirB2 family protein [Novosphingobium umbonatum]RVU06435.1 hypothetical protein EOE18_06375 [Novosphingobium umbonatum]
MTKNRFFSSALSGRAGRICPKSWLRCGVIALSALWSQAAMAQAGFYGAPDPAGSGPLVGAVRWLQGTLLGTLATVVAVVAVAAVGLGMLSGRVNWRHGASVIVGCFILFGAASIVAGIQSAASMGQ